MLCASNDIIYVKKTLNISNKLYVFYYYFLLLNFPFFIKSLSFINGIKNLI